MLFRSVRVVVFPDAVWEYYYAHTARKIAPALEALGRADAARDLRERADIIYEGT